MLGSKGTKRKHHEYRRFFSPFRPCARRFKACYRFFLFAFCFFLFLRAGLGAYIFFESRSMGILIFHHRTSRFLIRIIQMRNIYAVNIFFSNGRLLSTRFHFLGKAQAYVAHILGKNIFNNLSAVRAGQQNLFNQ